MKPCARQDRVFRLLVGNMLVVLLALGPAAAPAGGASFPWMFGEPRSSPEEPAAPEGEGEADPSEDDLEAAGPGSEPAAPPAPLPESTPSWNGFSAPPLERFAFREESVTLGEEPWELEGILSVPEGLASFPAVVLVAGFGPYDRDATIGPNKPFRDLARGLAQRGIASLRYDKRSAVHGPKMDRNAITAEDDILADALTAAELLGELEGVSARFVVGHGLGATLAPEIAQRVPAQGAVLLAPFVTPLDELVLRQMEATFGSDGILSEAERAHLERAQASVEQFRAGQTDPAQTYLGPSRYFVDLRQRDPVRKAQEYSHPMLILQGGRDPQVPPSELDRWREALGSRPDVTFRLFPQLNHTFTWGPDPTGGGAYTWPRQVRDEVVETIARWILDHAPALVYGAPEPEASEAFAEPGMPPESPGLPGSESAAPEDAMAPAPMGSEHGTAGV